MFERILERFFPDPAREALLAKYQINMGTIEPKWEQLKDVSIFPDVKFDSFPNGLTVWEFYLETEVFRIVMNPSEQLPEPDPYGPGRMVAAYVREAENPKYKPADDRFWGKQIDGLRSLMPELHALYRRHGHSI